MPPSAQRCSKITLSYSQISSCSALLVFCFSLTRSTPKCKCPVVGSLVKQGRYFISFFKISFEILFVPGWSLDSWSYQFITFCGLERGVKFIFILNIYILCLVTLLRNNIYSCVDVLRCTWHPRAVLPPWPSWSTTTPLWPTAWSPLCTIQHPNATSPQCTVCHPSTTSGKWSAQTSPWSTSWGGGSTERCTWGCGKNTTWPWPSRH